MSKYRQNVPRTILRVSYNTLNYKQRMELMAHRAKLIMENPNSGLRGGKSSTQNKD